MQAQQRCASVKQSTKELVRGHSSFGYPKSARLATLKTTVFTCEEEDYKSSGTGRSGPLFRSEDVSADNLPHRHELVGRTVVSREMICSLFFGSRRAFIGNYLEKRMRHLVPSCRFKCNDAYDFVSVLSNCGSTSPAFPK